MVSVVTSISFFPQSEGTVKMKPKIPLSKFYLYRPYNFFQYYRTLLSCHWNDSKKQLKKFKIKYLKTNILRAPQVFI